jgi:hypothetical protein
MNHPATAAAQPIRTPDPAGQPGSIAPQSPPETPPQPAPAEQPAHRPVEFPGKPGGHDMDEPGKGPQEMPPHP